MVVYKRITRKNISHAIRVAKIIFPYEWHEEDGQQVFWPQIAYEESLSETWLRYYLCYVGKRIVGITGWYIQNDIISLGWYGVLPDFRGHGYGKTILLKTIRMVRQKNFDTLYLYSSNRCEEKTAHTLYRSIGFTLYKRGFVDQKRVFYFKKQL